MTTKLDIHTHTVASGHGYSSLEENITVAVERGLELLGFTDHAPAMPGGAHLYHFYNIRILPPRIRGVRVLKGVEANIISYDGAIDLDDEVLENLELVIASFHPPCLKYSSREKHTRAIIGAMENPRVNIIGHPGDARYDFDIPVVVAASKRTGTLLEINNSSLKPTSFRPGGDIMIRRIIEACRKADVPVVMGSDAHYSGHVGRFEAAQELLDRLDFPGELVLNGNPKAFLDCIGNPEG